MTIDEIWNALLAKNKRLADPEAKIEFVSKNLRKLLQQVYDQGAKTGRSMYGEMESLLNAQEEGKKNYDQVMGMFDDMLKGKRT